MAMPSMASATRVALTPLRLELRQVGGRHLAALAGDLEQPVLQEPAARCRRAGRAPATP
ncbi:hypothetical protein LNP20_30100 [Klebsiella pneumoniae subsp. pneumoniae]|nr:hypothetical protein [Klebsiella pneumoniae subsp. pneumoniae]